MIRVFENRAGFALPTILIASMVMLIVLITSVSATSSVRSGLDGQYYTQLAREAAESGLARANGCLQDSGYVATWSASRLYPNTTCSGGSACTNTASCFVTQRPTIRTTFNVSPPEDLTIAQVIRSEGRVELLRASTGEVWRTYTYVASARVSVDLSLNTVAFGYEGGYGAYFATIGADGVARGVGYNGNGHLGNGTYDDSLAPTPFKIPSTERPVSIFTNFVSGGFSTYVLTNSGKLYGSGYNGYGQLGDGTTTSYRPTPVLYNMPGGMTAKFVAINGFASFVLASDDKVYATGYCPAGLLGYGYTITGCAHRSTPIAVALPSPVGDPNMVPTNNIVTDYLSAYARLQGGRVYGWGGNSSGQLITNNNTDAPTPVRIGTYGDVGQPKATQVAFDGISVMIVDENGDVKGGGSNTYGILGGERIAVANVGTGKCIDNTSSNGVNLQLYTCNQGTAQELTFRSDGSIYNPASNKCIDNAGSNGVTLQLYTCNNTNAQKFVMRNDRTIYNTSTAKCFNNPNLDGVTFQLDVCNTSSSQQFRLEDSKNKLVKFGLPASAGNIIKVATDAWFMSALTDTGEVWSAGINNKGQLGNGATATYQPYPVQFILPSGVTAKDVYSAAYGPNTSPYDYNNTFVIGSDGKVYGAGSNAFGQLGDGTTTSRSTPVAMQVINGTSLRAKQVVSGYGTTVVLTEDRKVYTVGNNANGQLGDGTTVNSSVPKANRYTNVLPVTSF